MRLNSPPPGASSSAPASWVSCRRLRAVLARACSWSPAAIPTDMPRPSTQSLVRSPLASVSSPPANRRWPSPVTARRSRARTIATSSSPSAVAAQSTRGRPSPQSPRILARHSTTWRWSARGSLTSASRCRSWPCRPRQTGSEVTRNAVLGVPEHRVKASLRSALMLPRVAVVDSSGYDFPPCNRDRW